MAHPQQQHYCLSIKEKYPNYFKNVSVLDIGSMDINGTNHYLFEGEYDYVGIDLIEGPNVTFVGRGHEYKRDKLFDVAISTECFEHDEFWKESFQNMFNLLKPSGLLLFTCATGNRGEHGTLRSRPEDAPGVVQIKDYYKNLSEQDYRNNFDLDKMFSDHKFEINYHVNDLYFYGIKR